ncbi:MAG: sigma-54 interaction domain-containing protein [Phycisphaerae bacterium]
MAGSQANVLSVSADDLVGRSPAMEQLRSDVLRIARHNINVLLEGESGTGKELVARLLHASGPRSSKPFVGVNCAAIHESLLESELFGHEAGAFTGAAKATLGFLRCADEGTVLLDEIGDMSEALQSKLLRVLEQREVIPVGSTKRIPVNVRVVAATHRDLLQAVHDGSFRRDLYYRINVVRLYIPPLRERREDIPPLAERFSRSVARTLRLQVREISPAAMKLLQEHDWPGNVRELSNVIQRAYVLGSGGTIGPDDLPERLGEGGLTWEASDFPTLDEQVCSHVRNALSRAGGVRTRAADMLGIDRSTLWRMIKRYDLRI